MAGIVSEEDKVTSDTDPPKPAIAVVALAEAVDEAR
jgi:hypothetical protein